MSLNYSLSSSYGYGGDDGLFSPEMDDATMDDRLEQARLNRTNYYRRMLASRNRPMDDYSVSKKSSYHVGSGTGSPARETSISDTTGTCSIPKMPEPHSSWRFYTSYDNGEWKRHAVPVDHDEEEILREPTKTLRRERDKLSPPTENSIRRMRQAGGPLMACMQPRPKRTSESSNDGRKEVSFQVVNGRPPVNGIDAQLGPAELMSLYGNEDLVRQILEGGGELVSFDGENQPQGKVKQEYSSKYMSTVTTTQPPPGRLKSPGAVAVGGGGGTAGVAKTEADASGVRKSQRPRIYGFQEKIIIPTKYKTMVEKEENGAGIQGDSVNQAASQVSQVERKENERAASATEKSEFKVLSSPVDRSDGAAKSLRSSPGGRAMTPPESQTVKVVVVNSGSDGEGDRKSEEHVEKQEQEQEQKQENGITEVAQKETGKADTFLQSPFVMQEGLSPMENFQAFQDNFRKQFENAGKEKKDGTVVEKTASNQGQRLFSKDEQTFSDVGPDGQKRDGKVLQTYEVITTTDGDTPVEDNKLSIMEIPITPVGAVRSSSKMAAISLPKSNDIVELVRGDSAIQSPFGIHKYVGIREMGDARANPQRTQKTVEIVRESGASESPLSTRRIVEMVRETGGRDANVSPYSPRSGEPRRTVQTFDDIRSGSMSPRLDDRKTGSVFDQTGSLFKQLSPRPRAEREKDSMSTRARDARQWSCEQGQGSPLGGYTTRSSRPWMHGDGLHRNAGGSFTQPQSTRRKVVIVREIDATEEDQSQNSGETVVDAQGDSAREGSFDLQRTVDTAVRETGASVEHPSTIQNTVKIFRELEDGTSIQPTSQRTVEIVRETSSTTGNQSNTDETVNSLREIDAGNSSFEDDRTTSIGGGGRTLLPSMRKDPPDQVGLNEEHRSSKSTTETTCIRQTGNSSQTKDSEENSSAEPFDSQWEVQIAVKD